MQNGSIVKDALLAKAEAIAKEFEFTADHVRRATKHFQVQMRDGLSKSGTTLGQIPSYVTSVPNGTEKGVYLAIDLGGTNFRVCSVHLHGDSTYTITQSKVAIPPELMVGTTSAELFGFIAKHIQKFLEEYHKEHLDKCSQERQTSGISDAFRKQHFHRLGFTFSFAFEQHSLDRGTLLYWTKGFDIPDMVGKEVCQLLQVELDRLELPVLVTALVNDTVGTLMARAYASPEKAGTLLGGIFGTGTNGAYVEKLSNVVKMPESANASANDLMIINTEWGGFDDELSVLPNTKYDQEVDKDSVNPDDQRFEKLISGMYLGEILRRIVLDLVQSPNSVHLDMSVPSDSLLYKPWSIDTSLLSIVAADSTADFSMSRAGLEKVLGASNVSERDARAIKVIIDAIGRRAARLAGVALAAIIIQSGRLGTSKSKNSDLSGPSQTLSRSVTSSKFLSTRLATFAKSVKKSLAMLSCMGSTKSATKLSEDASDVSQYQDKRLTSRIAIASSESVGSSSRSPSSNTEVTDNIIDIGLDGSLIEKYPNFEAMIRTSLRDVEEIGEAGDKRIRIGLAIDGSGVGAALTALAAMEQGK